MHASWTAHHLWNTQNRHMLISVMPKRLNISLNHARALECCYDDGARRESIVLMLEEFQMTMECNPMTVKEREYAQEKS
jgi:hypothetical protein